MEMVGAASGSLLVFDREGKVVEAAMAYGGQVQTPNVQQIADTVQYGLAGWVFENRQPALVPSTRDDPRWLPRSWDDVTPRSAVCVPLMDHGRVTGVLTLVQKREGQFNHEHLVMLSAIAVIVSFSAAIAIQKEND
jgi:GAF domain-containing protein